MPKVAPTVDVTPRTKKESFIDFLEAEVRGMLGKESLTDEHRLKALRIGTFVASVQVKLDRDEDGDDLSSLRDTLLGNDDD